MNAKKAKAIRKMAREVATETPEFGLLKNRKTGQIIVNPRCERGVERKLKKMAKTGARQ